LFNHSLTITLSNVELFSELATAAFFCLTGYMFKPADNNPYFEMADVDDVNDRRSVSMKGVDV
jgi:hypothetical protein